jgi:hypothetical protein
METPSSDDETTMPPTSKAELLGRIRREHAALEQRIARLSDHQMLVPVEHDWSVKDLLAHITAWEQVTLLVHLANQPFHEVIDLPGVRYGVDNVDTINDAFYRRDKDKPLPQVRAAFDHSYDQIVAAIESLDEARLFEHYVPRGREGSAGGQLIEWVVGDTYEHYQEHRLTIEAFAG